MTNKERNILSLLFSEICWVLVINLVFGFSWGVLEGLGSSGRLIASISTYPGTYKGPGSRVMTTNPPGDNCLPSTVGLSFIFHCFSFLCVPSISESDVLKRCSYHSGLTVVVFYENKNDSK